MSVLIAASSEPRTGRSLVAAAIAYRLGRAGKPVTLARLAGDDSASADAATFAALEYITSPGKPLAADSVKSLSGDIVLEAPPGSVKQLAEALGARVLGVGTATAAPVDAAAAALAGAVITRVPASQMSVVAERAGVLAVLLEDRVLAAPSIADIAAAVQGEWLLGGGLRASIGRVMIGTISSDAASPYFGNRERKCVVTRFDKTDVQLAALQTDVECLVVTGGGEPSPYLLDRARGMGNDIAVVRAPGSTVETMRAIEALYGLSRFDGAGKLERAVELLDEANFPVEL